MKGLIFNIRKYSVHDGPGIRITVFMKGCPLKCQWCHNPEGMSPFPEEIVQRRKIGEKEYARKEEAGRYYNTEEILELVRNEEVFIRHSGGGVTFSGGEPLMQPEFTIEALHACRESGFHTALDTSGYARLETFASVIPQTDLFLFDIKHLDPVKHEEFTGMPNSLILSNLKFLLESGKEVWIRFPVIPGMNDDDQHLLMMKDFLLRIKRENLKKLCLLPFHRTGSSKYRKMDRNFLLENTLQPSPERMKWLKDFFSDTGIKVKIGG